MARKRVRFGGLAPVIPSRSRGEQGQSILKNSTSRSVYTTKNSPYVDFLPEYDQDMYVVSSVPRARREVIDYEAELDDSISKMKRAQRLGNATLDDTDALYNRSRRSDRGLLDSITDSLQRMEMENVKIDSEIKDKVGFRRFLHQKKRREAKGEEPARVKRKEVRNRVKDSSLRVDPLKVAHLQMRYLGKNAGFDDVPMSIRAGIETQTMRNNWVPKARVPFKERSSNDDVYVPKETRPRREDKQLDAIVDRVAQLRRQLDDTTRCSRNFFEDLDEDIEETRRPKRPLPPPVEEEDDIGEAARNIYVVGGSKDDIDPKAFDHLEPGDYMVITGPSDETKRESFFTTQRRIIDAEMNLHQPDLRRPRSMLLGSASDVDDIYDDKDDFERRPIKYSAITAKKSAGLGAGVSRYGSAVPPRPASIATSRGPRYQPLYTGTRRTADDAEFQWNDRPVTYVPMSSAAQNASKRPPRDTPPYYPDFIEHTAPVQEIVEPTPEPVKYIIVKENTPIRPKAVVKPFIVSPVTRTPIVFVSSKKTPAIPSLYRTANFKSTSRDSEVSRPRRSARSASVPPSYGGGQPISKTRAHIRDVIAKTRKDPGWFH
ncbi:unnamed protein product [Owenia fusiformis]|uniref:Uncharacterized protein n=1 Tax=Owenia fusiformis TaxID=6347 RepID=A0A8S4NBU0_OWEFU|nr:unnamed protein product [Owenia fusiformis]